MTTHGITDSQINGTPIYTKGKISREGDVDYFYVLVSAKIAT